MLRKDFSLAALFVLLASGCSTTPDVPVAKKQQVTVRPVEKAALVVLSGKDVPEENADVVRTALARQLLKRYELELLWGKQFEEALSGIAGNGSAAECGRKVEEFAAAVERLQLGKAGGLWAEIEKSLSSCGPWLDEGKLVKLLVTRARLSVTTGRKAEAEEAFRKLVTMNPKLEPSAAGIDGKILGPFQTARQQVLSGLRHPLNLESTPTGADVIADGLRACRTPCKLQLYSGMHFLRLERAGHTTWTHDAGGRGPSLQRHGPGG
ncbi:MAG: PEGA domain-containing protein, partial [Deltaproteobacteria bacterium]